jgi:prevent-host-death family protein
MKTVNIQAAKTHLSRLVEEAAAGEDIVLAKAGRPLVRLIPYTPDKQSRKLGGLKGKVLEAVDCWKTDTGLEQSFVENPVLPEASTSSRF